MWIATDNGLNSFDKKKGYGHMMVVHFIDIFGEQRREVKYNAVCRSLKAMFNSQALFKSKIYPTQLS